MVQEFLKSKKLSLPNYSIENKFCLLKYCYIRIYYICVMVSSRLSGIHNWQVQSLVNKPLEVCGAPKTLVCQGIRVPR